MKVQDPVCGMPIETESAQYTAEIRGNTYYFCSEQHRHTFLQGSRIAYFSMEVGLKSDIPTYAGGLGILAGDVIRSSADLRIPLVAVTLVSRTGYVQQVISDVGEQQDQFKEWDPASVLRELPGRIQVPMKGRTIEIRSWLYDHQSPTGSMVPILFLDTDLESNAAQDREITNRLYGGDSINRLKQAIVLGIGGFRMLEKQGFPVRKYHINEGQSGLLLLELLKQKDYDKDTTSDHSIFTTHTPIPAAFFAFPYDTMSRLLGDTYDLEKVKPYAGTDSFNATSLCLNLSTYVNGVAVSHMEYSKRLYPAFHLRAVTNGVHPHTWTSPPFGTLFDKYLPGWANEPELLVRVDEIPREEIREAHQKNKSTLMEYIRNTTGKELDTDTLTIGFARRMTAYKRPTLIFSDLDRLRDVNRRGKIQLVFAGKAHPGDEEGKNLIREIYRYADQLKGEIEVVFLQGYDMDLAKKLIAGVDVWLNTPLPPNEASGTSGMKAAFNGVMNFSVLDGWWIEGCVEEVTGWSIGPSPEETISEDGRKAWELDDLYGKLKFIIVPSFYHEEEVWTGLMRKSIGKIANYFNSHRMMQRYATEAYL